MATSQGKKALRRDFDASYAIILTLFVAAYVGKVLFPHWGAFPLLQHHDIYAFLIVVLLSVLARLFGGTKGVIIAFATIASFVVLTIGHDPLIRYLTLAAILFSIGMYGMVVSRNAVRVLMSIELMLNAVNINLVTFARYVDPTELKGQIFTIFILTVAAAEAVVGLAIVLAVYRNMATVDMERFNLLKW